MVASATLTPPVHVNRMPHHDGPGETCFLSLGKAPVVRIETAGGRPAIYRPAKVADAWGCLRDGWRQVETEELTTLDDAIAFWSGELSRLAS
jgi:hypothetical protein